MKINSEQEMLDFGRDFANRIKTESPKFPTVIELVGDVGTGKTTFTRGFAAGLGATESITSPSFTISKTYALPDHRTLIHYDFYRLSDPGLMSNSLSESINDHNNIIVIEWSNSVKNILPHRHYIITITKSNDGSREITIDNSSTNNHQTITPSTKTKKTKTPVYTNPSNTNHDHILSLYLDTSTPETILKLNNQEYRYTFGNDLAENIFTFIEDKLEKNHKNWQDITEIKFMSGPGSFTGLRIGATVVNTLAHELKIPLYDHHNQRHNYIIPEYGRPANISKPIK